jgi:thiamine-phosphate pyrophosphorylase
MFWIVTLWRFIMENQSLIKGIYLVAGLRFHPSIPEFLNAVEQSFIGGIRLFQLRVKDKLADKEHLELARRVRELTRQYDVAFFINDRPDIAKLCEADGLHLGPDDMSAANARKIVGDMVIGKSSHSLEQAQSALQEEISYLSIGPVFETDCKKTPDAVVGTELLNKVLGLTKTPVVAIGGITLENIPRIRQTGVGCCGLIRGIMQSPNIEEAARSYVAAFSPDRP